MIRSEAHISIINSASNNTPPFNLLKIIEELTEFQEIAIKLTTKHPNNPHRPDKEELIKEFGDIMYRGLIYLKEQFRELTLQEILDKLENRLEKKALNSEKYNKT